LKGDSVNYPIMEKAGIITASLAEVYLEQGYLEKAIAIYDKLLEKEPGNETYKARVTSLKKTLKEKQKTSFFKRFSSKKNS
jgi:hypothetical protein